MPRATTKTDLIADFQAEKDKLDQFLAALTPEQKVSAGALGDWSPKDVLAHLAEWMHMLLGWYAAGQRGEKPILPAPGYKWSQLPVLNQVIYEKYAGCPLEEVEKLFADAFEEVRALAFRLSEEDLFRRGRYPWAGSNTLALLIQANTGSHFRWAHTQMRKKLFPRRKKAAA